MPGSETKGKGPDFIGLGAQKAGTSWIYACLHDHPAIFIPIKELHFFSRERFWKEGPGWYESHFSRSPTGSMAGEFSTTYLFHPEAAARIHRLYPGTRLMACLRDPASRAFSNYVNDIKAGFVKSDLPFRKALDDHPEYLTQGMYAKQLERFYSLYPRDQLLVLFYEDIQLDARAFMRRIYEFLGVDENHLSSFLQTRINEARIPRSVRFEAALERAARTFRRMRLDRVLWMLKRMGLSRVLRRCNTTAHPAKRPELPEADRKYLRSYFQDEISRLEELLGFPITKWGS